MANNPTGFLSPVTQALYGGPNSNGPAPQANLTGMQNWMGGTQAPVTPGQNIGAQESALTMAQRTASGQGPSAAADLLKAQTDKAQGNANALASSAPGRSGAEARRTAILAGTSATQELGANAAVARSKEQLEGESLLGQLSGQARGQDLQAAGLSEQASMGNANLALGQNQLNEQAAEFKAGQNQQMIQSMMGMAGGAALAFADADIGEAGADFVEPPGKNPEPAMVSLREISGPDENPMLIMINQRSGKIQKVAGTDLTPEEMACVQRPHGAGPMDANSPNRQAKQMSDGDMGPAPGAPTPKSFVDVVRMAHSGLYADGDVGDAGPGKTNMLGPNAPRTSVNMVGNPAPYYKPDDTVGGVVGGKGISNEDLYYSQAGTDKNGDFVKGTQMATAASQGKVQPAHKPVYFDNPELQSSLHQQTGQGSSPGNPFMRALGGAFAGYANPKGVGNLYSKRPVYQLQDTGTPNVYQDADMYSGAPAGKRLHDGDLGDISAQLDEAHQREMNPYGFRAPRAQAPTPQVQQASGVSAGDVTETPNDEQHGIVVKSRTSAYRPLRGDYAQIRAEQERRAMEQAPPPDPTKPYAGDQGSSMLQDPYRNLPQGPALHPYGEGDTRVGTFKDVSDQNKKERFEEREFPRFGEKQDQEWETAERHTPNSRLHSHADVVPAGYMDADLGLSASHPAHEARGYAAQGGSDFKSSFGALKSQLDAKDKAKKGGDLTSKFAVRRSKKRKK